LKNRKNWSQQSEKMSGGNDHAWRRQLGKEMGKIEWEHTENSELGPKFEIMNIQLKASQIADRKIKSSTGVCITDQIVTPHRTRTNQKRWVKRGGVWELGE